MNILAHAYRAIHLVVNQSWVDLDFHFTVCPIWLGLASIWQKGPSS